MSPRILSPATPSGRRRTLGVSAPPPLVWSCTAALVLGLFCSRGQGLEKRLRLDDRRLARKDLLHEDAVDFLVCVCTAILKYDERIVSISGPPHRGQHHPTGGNPQQDETRHLVRP